MIEKPWGRYEIVEQAGSMIVMRLELIKGGFSSVHRHDDHDNTFTVVSGKVRVFMGSDHIDLTSGASVTVGKGTWHQFVALANSVVMETVFRVDGKDASLADITRLTTGGINDAQD